MSLMIMTPNSPLNLYMYIEQRRKLHKNLYMHRHPRPWTAPDQSWRDGDNGSTGLGLRTTDSMETCTRNNGQSCACTSTCTGTYGRADAESVPEGR